MTTKLKKPKISDFFTFGYHLEATELRANTVSASKLKFVGTVRKKMFYFPDLEWFLSGVATHMLTQIKALLEALRAVGAEIALGSCQAVSCCLLAFS